MSDHRRCVSANTEWGAAQRCHLVQEGMTTELRHGVTSSDQKGRRGLWAGWTACAKAQRLRQRQKRRVVQEEAEGTVPGPGPRGRVCLHPECDRSWGGPTAGEADDQTCFFKEALDVPQGVQRAGVRLGGCAGTRQERALGAPGGGGRGDEETGWISGNLGHEING